jgi:hypothetical protein
MDDFRLPETKCFADQSEQSDNSSLAQDNFFSILPRLPVISSINTVWESL